MSFPWTFSDGFESGTTVATTTSGLLIDFPHFTDLARSGMAPYRGAYCMRIKLAGGTTSQFMREDTAFDDLLADVTGYLRFYFYLGKDLVMANADKFSLIELESSLNTTTEIAAGIQRTSGNLEFWFNETQAAASPSTLVLGTTTTALNKWYCLELKVNIDAGGGNDGTIDAYIDDALAGTQIASLDQGAIVDGKIGVIGPDAGTSGTVLIDDVIYDENRIYANKRRFRNTNAHQTFATDHPLIGPGKVAITVTGTSDNAVAAVYDTDTVPNNLSNGVTLLRNITANESVPGHDIFEVQHGLYIVLSGTGVQAFVSVSSGGMTSDGSLITHALATKRPMP